MWELHHPTFPVPVVTSINKWYNVLENQVKTLNLVLVKKKYEINTYIFWCYTFFLNIHNDRSGIDESAKVRNVLLWIDKLFALREH